VDAGVVGEKTHFAAESIDLTDEMPLGRPADGGIAGHAARGKLVHGHEQDGASHPRSGKSSLNAGMTSTGNGDIVRSSSQGVNNQ
jgi:hypothetical protein